MTPHLWQICVGEILGTMVLIMFGNGVGSNNTYKKSYGHNGGVLMTSIGWALGVYFGVIVANIFHTGGYLNPAITLTQMIGGNITVGQGFVYFASEFIGAIIGQVIIDIIYFDQIKKAACVTVLSTHATAPINPKRILPNILTEYVGTIALIGAALFADPLFGLSGTPAGNFVNPLAVSMIVLAIGLSLGGTTGYAINPTRDLCPRLVHFVMYKTMPSLKSQENIKSNWRYAPLPFFVPLLASATLGGLLQYVN